VGVHRITERPVVHEGQVVARPTAFISCTFDHRALDGSQAGAFLVDLVAALERELGDLSG
jgi:pyruvate/2-oxoglutarate dehydrogenase complex dihydrolipoamide acyltransferase (E2) component